MIFSSDYGFVVPSNPYDTIELKYDGAFLDAASMAVGITSPNFSAPKPWQQQILSQLKLHGEASDLKVCLLPLDYFKLKTSVSKFFNVG